ncbi:hypothetical protein RI138_15525 [Streptomyces sp. C11-1]|uniref:Secreted protein n=1 Tax=Streptomyces durocortorensis TaxID=2811104 RepID=A0ABY9VWF2_9ACTN|nr:hypothetical protein [Streptomyces durocortorensis]WNF28128.1 hypothetical protein RI138_15525 [Streptomyces durocortorensis]
MRRQMRKTRQARQARQSFGFTGRRGSAIVASAAALCLGGALTACAGGPDGDEGYVAVGAAAEGGKRPPEGAGQPSGEVTLTPLDGDSGRGAGRPGEGPGDGPGSGRGRASPPSPEAGAQGSPDSGGGESTRTPGGQGGGSAVRPSAKPSGGGSGSPSAGRPDAPAPPRTPEPGDGSGGRPSGPGTPGAPAPTPPAPPPGPAVLKLSAPQRAAADRRWCEKVTVEFRNTGDSPARSGTVTFATHIIGALGVDWATIRTAQPLPAPIGAGAARTETYTVCVDSWRVPLGMRVETQDVSAVWK